MQKSLCAYPHIKYSKMICAFLSLFLSPFAWIYIYSFIILSSISPSFSINSSWNKTWKIDRIAVKLCWRDVMQQPHPLTSFSRILVFSVKMHTYNLCNLIQHIQLDHRIQCEKTQSENTVQTWMFAVEYVQKSLFGGKKFETIANTPKIHHQLP